MIEKDCKSHWVKKKLKLSAKHCNKMISSSFALFYSFGSTSFKGEIARDAFAVFARIGTQLLTGFSANLQIVPSYSKEIREFLLLIVVILFAFPY